MTARHAASVTPAALRALDALEAVDLEQLNAEAELQTRVDRKYMLPIAALPALLERLPDGVRVLDLDGARASSYESVYFDTPELTSFRLAAHARRRRFKIRTRSYVDSEASFLEVKTRGGRALTVKDRIPVDPALTATLSGEARAYADEVLVEAGVGDLSHERLEPVLTTAYRRATLLLPAASGRPASRATIDVDLAWTDRGVDGRFRRMLRTPDSAIVETKSGAQAGAVDRALWAAGHRPMRVSKYATGLAAIRPGLPANRWMRVLDRHFRAAIAQPLD
ncbi:polyphosphate polymerase domain-containing protein [Agromyces sp. NPDC056523]|uniref:polyphosphate polymerase domain-containing protein n=1 Tax=Agromyces sp. NPDC056523 TaxID=3345850 RepID=UPI003672E8DC